MRPLARLLAHELTMRLEIPVARLPARPPSPRAAFQKLVAVSEALATSGLLADDSG